AMRNDGIVDLAECTEFRQTLQARPPRIVHGTALLVVTLLGAALLWAAVTQADLVVRAPGHVRPVTPPVKVYNPGRGEVLSSSSGCRVLEVRARKGDRVKKGDVLICLDTWSLDKDIAKQQRTIEDGQEELGHLDRLMELLARQHKAAVAEAEWDLERTQE